MNKRKIRNIIIIVSLIICISLTVLFTPQIDSCINNTLATQFNIVSSKENLLVHYISVGSGDAIAVNLPDGKTLLIDTGLKKSNTHYVNYITDKVMPSDKDNKVDYLVLTHADADHIGGVVKLLSEVQVDKVVLPKVASNSEMYKDAVEKINEKSTAINVDDFVGIDGTKYSVEVFGPLDFSDTNNACPIIKIVYMNKSFLFVGDIEEVAEKKFVELYGEQLDSDVLKVAHHGSNTSTCENFLTAVTPEVAIISVGENDKYNNPDSETLAILNAYDIEIKRTDELGDIVIAHGGDYNALVLDDDIIMSTLEFHYYYLIIAIDGILSIGAVRTATSKKSNKTLKKR